MSRTTKLAILVFGGGLYLLLGWMVTVFVATLSAWANGPCETNDCPEGVPSAWAFGVPIFFIASLVAMAILSFRRQGTRSRSAAGSAH